MGMRYRTVLKRTEGADRISLTSQWSVVPVLNTSPLFLSFTADKIRFRHSCEKDFSKGFKGSFRCYLEELTAGRPSSAMSWIQYDGDIKEVEKVILGRWQILMDKYQGLEEELFKHIWTTDNIIHSRFTELGLKEAVIRSQLKGLYAPKNSAIYLTVTLRLDEKTKEIFINQVKDTWGDKIVSFSDAVISKGDEVLFCCMPHEDWYSFSKKKTKK